LSAAFADDDDVIIGFSQDNFRQLVDRSHSILDRKSSSVARDKETEREREK